MKANHYEFNSKYISDDFEETFSDFDALKSAVVKMEDNSKWINGIPTTNIAISSIEGPICCATLSDQIHVPEDILVDTATIGTMLYTTVGDRSWAMRGSSKMSLFTRAGINGAALGRLAPADLAEVLNLCLNVSKGSSILLERYGKIAAFHSDASDGYCPMQISLMLDMCLDEMKARFGTPQFTQGYNSHSYTSCDWMLPDVADELSLKYQMALINKVGPQIDGMDIMPYLHFSSSDTANASAVAQPLFKLSGRNGLQKLNDGVMVKHVKTGKTYGLEKFQTDMRTDLFSRFYDAFKEAERMGQKEIYHAENVVVGICNEQKIPRKYGNIALEEIQQLLINYPTLSAYDIYLALTEMVGQAEQFGASQTTRDILEEKVYKVVNPYYDWDKLDVSGTVAWANTTAQAKEVG